MAKFKLSKKHREEVEYSYDKDNGARSFQEHCQSELEKYLARRLEQDAPVYGHLSEAQRVAAAVAWDLRGSGPLIRGVAKRLVEDVPGELARSASLYARLEAWNGALDEDDLSLGIQWSLYPALAAGDHFYATRYATEMPSVTERGAKDVRLLHNLFMGALLRDDDLLAAAIAEFDEWKKPKKTVAAMAEVFRALHRRDPDEVARALDDLHGMSRKIWHLFEIFNIVSFETHGLYELCRWVDPALVEGFDTDRPLPWDAGLWRWVRDHEGESPFHDVTALSPVLQQWLEELPFKADGEQYWPGGVAIQPPEPDVLPTPAPPIRFDESWRVVLTVHATEEIDKQYALDDTLFEGEEGLRSWGTASQSEKLPIGEYAKPRGDQILCLQRKRQPWFLVAGDRVTDDWVRKIGKRKRLRTISVGYDADKQKTHLRAYEEGKIAIDFEATGPADATPKKRKLKSVDLLDGVVADGATPADTLEALLAHLDARQMLLRVAPHGAMQRLEWQNGDPLPVVDISRAYEAKFYGLRSGENLASDALDNAIFCGDADAVRRAIADGAALDWLPESPFSPLRKAVNTSRGDWKGCVAALVEAGAPVDGYAGEAPPISDVFAGCGIRDGKGLGQLNAIEAIDCLLSHGADVNAVDPTNHGEGATPLIHSAKDCQPLIVARLLTAGADLKAVDRRGRTAQQVAQERTEQFKADAGKAAKRVVTLLTDREAGRLDDKGLARFLAEERTRIERLIAEDMMQRNARFVLMQSPEIEIRELPDFGEADYAKPFVADLESAGFEKFGYFQLLAAMKLRIVALHHPERMIYGMVVIYERAAFCDVLRMHNDDTAVNVASAEFSNDFSAFAESHEDLPIRYHVVRGGSVAELLAKLDSIPVPEAGAARVRPDELAARLRRHHERDIEGQQRVAKRFLGDG